MGDSTAAAQADPALELEDRAEREAVKVRMQLGKEFDPGPIFTNWNDYALYHLGRAEDELSGRDVPRANPPLRVAAAQVLEALRLALDPKNKKVEASTGALLSAAGMIRAAVDQKLAKKTAYPEKDAALARLLRDRLRDEMVRIDRANQRSSGQRYPRDGMHVTLGYWLLQENRSVAGAPLLFRLDENGLTQKLADGWGRIIKRTLGHYPEDERRLRSKSKLPMIHQFATAIVRSILKAQGEERDFFAADRVNESRRRARTS